MADVYAPTRLDALRQLRREGYAVVDRLAVTDPERAVVEAMRVAGWTEEEIGAAIRAVFDMRGDAGRPLADHEQSRCTAGHVRQMQEEYEELLDFVQDVEGEMRQIIARDYRGPKPADYAMAERMLGRIKGLIGRG